MNIFKKITSSKYYKLSKELITLDGSKHFIVSSLTYYLLISLVPLATISYYFLRILGVDDNQLNELILKYLPLIAQDSFSIANLFSNNIKNIITSIISIYIASKGLLNYFYYLNNKFNIKSFPYPFVLNKLYIASITLLFSLFFGLFIALRFSYLSSFFNHFKILSSLSLTTGIFIIVLLLNYVLLKRKVKLNHLILGSILSTILIETSSFVLTYYFSSFNNNEQYYGLLSDVIALLLYLYLLSYFLMLGNQLNYMIIKYKH